MNWRLIILPLQVLVLMVEHFFLSAWLGIEIFYTTTQLATEARKVAQDMRASMHGELREGIDATTIRRIDKMCSKIDWYGEKWTKANSITMFIAEPGRRNMLEVGQMLRDAAATWRQSTDGEPSLGEQGPATD